MCGLVVFGVDKPNPLSSRYLSQDERIIIADIAKYNASIRKISQRLGRAPFSISREVRANNKPDNRSYEPYRAHHISHQRLKQPKTPKNSTTAPAKH
ncbi:helix-turn-helix domain-containing protein [Arcanobacterium phocae]|uniref:helix-turn-helix domain-containing protein n=1 Tax=Arcanobacterium phocae TaxID=131112 RepID=UPI00345051FF